jgi:translation initiation factor IF-1
MVKNTGGCKTKSQARKAVNTHDNDDELRLPIPPYEKIAIVDKMLGNGMCYVTTDDGLKLICHIRNKFRGKFKKNNLIHIGDHIIIGLRHWETTPIHCDLISSFQQPLLLQQLLPQLHHNLHHNLIIDDI